MQRLAAGSVNKNTGTMAAGKSRFWRAPGDASPALNVDAAELLRVFEYLPHTFEQRAWAEDELLSVREAAMGVVKVLPAHACVAPDC